MTTLEMGSDLEDLVSDFNASFTVSNEENCATSRIDLYKSKTSKQDQETRRFNYLERQKSDRHKSLSVLRNIEDSDSNKKANPYKNQLMLSEWLDHEPDGFAESWLCKPAPVGHRTLIVAEKGRTASYTKSGYRTCTFPSLLPGGHNSTKSSYTVLDGVWCEESQCFYILDLICYKSHPLTDSEAEFRFFWGTTKFSEDLADIGEVQKKNPYPMIWLPHMTCDKAQLTTSVNKPYPYKIDGLLFYHKQGHYSAGSSPLVGWIKPGMLKEALDLDVNLSAFHQDDT